MAIDGCRYANYLFHLVKLSNIRAQRTMDTGNDPDNENRGIHRV